MIKIYFLITEQYIKMNKLAVSAMLLLLVVASVVVDATHPKFNVRVTEDNNVDQPATAPEKVNALF